MDWNNIEAVSERVLALVPQQAPFRFIDRILEIEDERIVGQYTFKQDEFFYRGHFPGRPVTPGVILIETMAQTAVVSLGIYLMLKEGHEDPGKFLTVFTEVNAEFLKEVKPGDQVTIKAERLFWRRRKLKAKAEIYLPNGELAVSATLSGLGVAS